MQISRNLIPFALAASALALTPGAALADPIPPASNTETTPVPVQPARGAEGAAERSTSEPTSLASDAERYAELESSSPDAADFEGGSRGVYIGTSAGVLIIVVVILVIVLL